MRFDCVIHSCSGLLNYLAGYLSDKLTWRQHAEAFAQQRDITAAQ